MDVDNGYEHETYRTLASIAHHRNPQISWKHRLTDDMESSMYIVDEIEDECFHTSDFEPFSDDDEYELSQRLIGIGENHYYCTSEISSLDYSLFEPKPGKRYESYTNNSKFCSGLMYLLQRTDGMYELRGDELDARNKMTNDISFLLYDYNLLCITYG